MIYKLLMSVYKEFLLLRRDLGGVVILFVMPLILIITVTLIQDSTFKSVTDSRLPVLLVNNDNGDVSKKVLDNLQKSDAFSIVQSIDKSLISEEQAKKLVFSGKYQLAIVIPQNLSSSLQTRVEANVQKILSNYGIGDSLAKPIEASNPKEVRMYFDPAVQSSFKSAVTGAIDKMISQIETQSIYESFQDQLGEEAAAFQQENMITFREIMPRVDDRDVIPNSVQHNVPAWTLFAIFFIVIPLSVNIVKEKNQGTFVRLQTNPVSKLIVISGKAITYIVICMIQFYMMVGVAVFLFPHLGLPSLNVEGNLSLMSLVALCSGFAAVGFGILLGTLARTQEQSAPFGATSAIILAAVGGVWVPVFAMPGFMQIVARSSPMNWALEAFYDVLLRNATLSGILPEASLLLLFFIITTGIALLYDKKKRAV